ncbi:MAG: ParB/RepB/Spo0J family partition protein [Candidatus Paceibacterota bacterium]
MSQFQENSVFWIEVDKIHANPYQPRFTFDEAKLEELADSIRQYGVLQPLVVTRKESTGPDGGIVVTYELIAGERRLRASKIAGVKQVPALIRSGEDDAQVKLELAIIENLQREDLNPVDRARAFERLAKEFNFKHTEIAKKVGKSREYVSNTLRLLSLPDEILQALAEKKITEGHTRPLMMLNDRPDEQRTLFREIVYKKVNVRDSEMLARRIAQDKVRKKEYTVDPEIAEYEGKLAESLGTRVMIERGEEGGRIMISFFSNDDLEELALMLAAKEKRGAHSMLKRFMEQKGIQSAPLEKSEVTPQTPSTPHVSPEESLPEQQQVAKEAPAPTQNVTQLAHVPTQDRQEDSPEEVRVSVFDENHETPEVQSFSSNEVSMPYGTQAESPAEQENTSGGVETPTPDAPSPVEEFEPQREEVVEEDDSDMYSIKNFSV